MPKVTSVAGPGQLGPQPAQRDGSTRCADVPRLGQRLRWHRWLMPRAHPRGDTCARRASLLGSGQCPRIRVCGHANLLPRRLLPLGARRSERLVAGRDRHGPTRRSRNALAGGTLVLAPRTAWRQGRAVRPPTARALAAVAALCLGLAACGGTGGNQEHYERP